MSHPRYRPAAPARLALVLTVLVASLQLAEKINRANTQNPFFDSRLWPTVIAAFGYVITFALYYILQGLPAPSTDKPLMPGLYYFWVGAVIIGWLWVSPR